jgi:hypothetical protein
MPFDAVHPAWTRSKERFFDRENFLRLIGHYEILGWGFQGVDVFSHEGQILTVEFALPMVPIGPVTCRAMERGRRTLLADSLRA